MRLSDTLHIKLYIFYYHGIMNKKWQIFFDEDERQFDFSLIKIRWEI